jgi:hypothetical protein
VEVGFLCGKLRSCRGRWLLIIYLLCRKVGVRRGRRLLIICLLRWKLRACRGRRLLIVGLLCGALGNGRDGAGRESVGYY